MLAQGTLVLDGNGQLRPVESFEPGETVLTADLERAWTVRPLQLCSRAHTLSASMLMFEGGSIVVSLDHVFVLADRSLRRTNELEVGDSLMAADGRMIAIQSNVLGQSALPFFELMPDVSAPASGQLLSTAGLLSSAGLGVRPSPR